MVIGDSRRGKTVPHGEKEIYTIQKACLLATLETKYSSFLMLFDALSLKNNILPSQGMAKLH